jgi:glycosyltransferase involved in cell wall biosynthesis
MAPGRVHVHPHVTSRAELRAVLSCADVFVHPNPREPFGITPLEAMSVGVPVVLPAAGGVLTYASDENAWLAPPDAAGLADAVCAALADGERRERRIAAARRAVEQFAWPVAAARTFSLYERIHDERRSGCASIAAASVAAGTGVGSAR